MSQQHENSIVSVISGSFFTMYNYITFSVGAEITHVFVVGVVGGAGGYFGKFLIHKTVLIFKHLIHKTNLK
jgi:hypothetical protein